MKYRGVAYYPEFWPEERWDEDVRLMKEAHINIARIGEFAWTAMEPAEGQFDLGWLHRIVDKLGKAGIKTLLCTPTATPPAWLTTTYPDTILVRRDGSRPTHGSRRHYCPTNDTFRRHSARITGQLAREFAQDLNIAGWQLDNEFGPEASFCYCHQCTGKFRSWLRNRYGNIQALNDAWQTRFWSIVYTEWQELNIRNGNSYPSVELDIARFHSDSFVEFAQQQATIIREVNPSALVTTNMMGPIYTPLDYYKFADFLDVVSDDLYFDIATMSANAAAMDIFRSMKPGKPFWITETGSGALTENKGPYPDQIRAWAYSALAHGSEAHLFFRWRTCLAGQEQDLQGIIETSGKPRYRYAAVQKLFTEMDDLSAILGDLPVQTPDTAMISSYDVHWMYESTRIGKQTEDVKGLLALHEMLYDRNIPVDIIPPDRDLASYKIVILPNLCHVPVELARRLKEFVKKGGVVFATSQLATRDENNNYVPRCAPDGLTDLFGLHVESHYYLTNANEADQSLWVPASQQVDETPGVTLLTGISGHANKYMEDIELEGAQPLGQYTDNFFQNQTVAAVHSYGNGAAFYLAAFLDPDLTANILEQALRKAEIPLGPETPKWVEVIRRGNFTFVINHSREEAEVILSGHEVVLGRWENGKAILPAYGVTVVRE